MSWFLRRRPRRHSRVGGSEYELQPSPAFLFERRILNHRGEVDQQGPKAVLVAANGRPHGVTRRAERILRRGQASILTITSDPGNSVVVLGGGAPDWSIFFTAQAFGRTEAEAERNARRRSLQMSGTHIAVFGPGLNERRHDTTGELVVEAPSDSGIVIHGSFASAEVRDLNGPVHIAATHARATVLGTGGRVDVVAGCVDFAGATGQVTLTAEMEINLKITAREFGGTLLAWAQRSVRMLVPQECTTSVEVMVASRDKFVCRAHWASKINHRRQGDLHVFTFGVNPDRIAPAALHLRSEQSTVVIDPGGGNP
jgi:hypothetical protein